ncbi:arginine--tRNA ligase [Candidatus Peregrinibacteria bacterium]|nr:MAG: arginine--tRNA ligase [Candidatus Peregrinibacteria bacterium]
MENPDEPPAIVRRSDGATLYLTRDLAQAAYWEKTWQPDLMIWVVDVAQSLHFRQRFYVTQKLGLTDAQMIHVDFGRMQFKDGSMSTRKGNMVKLETVMDEAEERSLKLIQEKAVEMNESEQKELARQMGIGSIRYNILQQNRISNIIFDWDKMLNFEGNSAPYLMYTIARAKSVLRKTERSADQIADCELLITDDHETGIILQALQYADVLHRAQVEFKPNHIANFLYDLAQKYNAFYNALPILKADENNKNSRLLITAAVIRLMEDGFSLLGLEVPEKM